MNTTTTTTHNQIGFTENVAIIEKALVSDFHISDLSGLPRTIAEHIWTMISARGHGGDDKIEWGAKEISHALKVIESRIAKLQKQFP